MRHLCVILALTLAGMAQGANYTRINVPTTATINKIYFNNDLQGWAVTSDGEILTTFDGGNTWRKMDVSKRNIRDIDFNNRDGYLAGDRGLLMKTTNGGAVWNDISQNIKYNFTGVGIMNDSSVIICGTDQNSISKTKGVIFVSRDYGKTWKKHDRHLGNGYTDLVVFPPKKVYLLAIKKVFHSINSGLSYFPGNYAGSRLAFGFDLMDDWGFMVGRNGYFARTTTHGRAWEEVKLEITKNLYAVKMFDHYSGVAVGEDGVVVYFFDDADRHTTESCGHEVDLYTVCVTGEKIFVGGDGGLLLSRERFPRFDDK